MTQTIDLTSEYPKISELTESERYSLLASDRRRLVLDVLSGRNAPMSLNALAVAVTVHETDADEDTPAEGAIERMAISLHHHHLPKMADLGLIDYDPESKRIE